jgi:6-phosphogluconolactonase (cycloisomerase 2 family)
MGLVRRIADRPLLHALASWISRFFAGSRVGKRLLESPGWSPPLEIPGDDEFLDLEIRDVDVPGKPFGIVFSADGQFVFVSYQNEEKKTGGVAVYAWNAMKVTFLHALALDVLVWDLTITRAGDLLLVANDTGVVFIDALRAQADVDAILGRVSYGAHLRTVKVQLSADERFVLATDEHQSTLTIIDITRAKGTGYRTEAVIQQLPLDLAPVGMDLSKDGRHLFVTCEMARLKRLPDLLNWFIYAATYRGSLYRAGVLTVVDLQKIADAGARVIATAPAGCHPVRVSLSDDGGVAWVTARASNSLLAFGTEVLKGGGGNALLATVATGPMPVGLALVQNGSIAVVSNSNRRLGKTERQTLSFIHTQKALQGEPAHMGVVRVGSFPRSLTASPDGSYLLVSNFDSASVSVLHIDALN